MSSYQGDDDKDMRRKLMVAAKKRAKEGMPVSEDEGKTIRLVHIIFAALCAVSAVVAFIVVASSPEKSTLRLLTSTDYRDSATTVDTDFYPELTFAMTRVINVGFVAAAVSAGAALGNVIGWLWWRQQAMQMMGGSNPYLWASFLIWHPIIFLLVSVVSGISNVFLLSFICLTVLGWLFLLWNADNMGSWSYMYSQHKAGAGMMGWNWLPVGFVLVLALSTYIMVLIYAFTTLRADAFTANAVTSGYYIAIVGVHLVLYLVNPVLFIVWKAGWISSIYTREMIYYIFNGIFAIAATWLTIGLFLADSVTLPTLP